MIVMHEQLNVEQRQAISETPAKGGGEGLVGTCSSSLGRMVAFRAYTVHQNLAQGVLSLA